MAPLENVKCIDHPHKGVLIVELETYHVIYADGGMQQHCPAMRLGCVCHEAFGNAVPCPNCPIRQLEEAQTKIHITQAQAGEGYINLAMRLRTQHGDQALVLWGELDEITQWSQKLQSLSKYMRQSAYHTIVEVDLETGYTTQYGLIPEENPALLRMEYTQFLGELLGKATEETVLLQTLSLSALRQRLAGPPENWNATISCSVKTAEALLQMEIDLVLLRSQGKSLAYLMLADATNLPASKNALETAGEYDWINDERYQIVLKQMRTMVFEFTPQTGKYMISPPVSDYLAGDYTTRDLPTVLLQDNVIFPEDRQTFERFYHDTLTQGGNRTITLRLKSRDDIFRWYKFSIATLSNEDGERILGSITDVDEETRLRESLRYRAEYDIVTGIYNKTTFFHRTEQLLWSSPGLQHSIIRFDIDRFKMVNDLFGISEGDSLLHFLGKCIQRRMHEGETYARLGDDVFGMCVARTDEEIQELVQELDNDLASYPLSFKLVPSAGVYRVRRYAGEPVNIMCDRASLAQKKVKGNFVSRLAFYETQMGQKLFHEQEIISEMHKAIIERQFEIFLQPKYDIQNNLVFGAEALVRWRHPTKGLIPPGEFIPLFEKNGFIISLDEYVWDLTCQTIHSWLERGFRPMPVSVNISRMHLYDPKLCEKFSELIRKYDIKSNLLELELTESAYVENPYFLGEVMERLQDQGFTFLMDDFGSGYSSLNMLRTIAVDVLKIDLGFLRECEEGTAGRIILESTINMARRLRLPVIAEGVETAEQASFLLSVGCTLAQGYYYARPMPVADFEREFFLSGQSEIFVNEQEES